MATDEKKPEAKRAAPSDDRASFEGVLVALEAQRVALERIAACLEALTGKLAPAKPSAQAPARTVKCIKGHGMQPGESYCQHCFRADNAPPQPA